MKCTTQDCEAHCKDNTHPFESRNRVVSDIQISTICFTAPISDIDETDLYGECKWVRWAGKKIGDVLER